MKGACPSDRPGLPNRQPVQVHPRSGGRLRRSPRSCSDHKRRGDPEAVRESMLCHAPCLVNASITSAPQKQPKRHYRSHFLQFAMHHRTMLLQHAVFLQELERGSRTAGVQTRGVMRFDSVQESFGFDSRAYGKSMCKMRRSWAKLGWLPFACARCRPNRHPPPNRPTSVSRASDLLGQMGRSLKVDTSSTSLLSI